MKHIQFFAISFICFAFISCKNSADNVLILWTDVPEIALYAQAYNASQARYKIEARQTRNMALELEMASKDKKIKVDIAAGRWLKSAGLTGFWQKTGFLFANKSVDKSMFYEPLMEYGKNGKDQLLLPVSFNLGALVFMPDIHKTNGTLKSDTFITLEEIKEQGIAFNEQKKGVWTRMGFSPTWNWNGDFLYAASELWGASFREPAQREPAQPLQWDEAALENTINVFKEWVNEGAGGAGAEDDFIFKYSHDPSDRLLVQGRILFAYMKSNSLFTLPPEEISRLDYRWLSDSKGGKIPVLEDLIMLGITKKCKAKKAAAAFVQWFYSESTQKELLTKTKNAHISDASFGICGGFSALREVTEYYFPREYPALLSHIPPPDYLLPPPPLPPSWLEIKERVVVPYIRERVKAQGAVRDLRRRLGDWLRMNNRGLGKR
jgi:ABC-type glycerol-3-phosphate transport system substrate-binding protein